MPGTEASSGGRGKRTPVSRMSLSLSEALLTELDAMVTERGFASRSQAVSSILYRSLVEHRNEIGDRVMVGTISLFYDNKVKGLQSGLGELQQENIAEVISSLHVHLEENQTLEVVLVQGPARKLKTIADTMISKRGVLSGRLDLVAALIPQVHPFRSEHEMQRKK